MLHLHPRCLLYANMPIVFSKNRIRDPGTFCDTLHLRDTSVGIIARLSHWYLQSSAVLNSQQSCFLLTHYDHVLFVVPDIILHSAKYIHDWHKFYLNGSVRVVIRPYLWLLSPTFNSCFHYIIFLVCNYSYYWCLVCISSVALLTSWYLSRTSLPVLHIPTQQLFPLTFMSITRKEPVCGIYVYPACFQDYAQRNGCGYSFKPYYLPLLVFLPFINIVPDQSFGHTSVESALMT